MNDIGNSILMAERFESFKAGIIGGLCLLCAFGITAWLAHLVLIPYLGLLSFSYTNVFDLHFIFSAAIAGFSGFLFGVTYRYIIRQDENPHLKSGAVLAFGLVRGLTQIDMGFNLSDTLIPAMFLAIPSLLWFFLTAKCLDLSIKWAWLKPFTSE
ncbi:MAG: hypothetical protein QNJ51_23200 [Calothrix sp. MO_167.B12]|nr:hypothetical protein [Calothrix sp. MO_167.B12]